MRRIFTAERDGFVGAYYGGPSDSRKAVILMLGDSSTDYMARCGAAWMITHGCHALTMSAGKKDYGHHNYPLERFGKAIAFLKDSGMEQIGIAGASTTGMLALVAASYYPEITLTIALSPSDFVMEGSIGMARTGRRNVPVTTNLLSPIAGSRCLIFRMPTVIRSTGYRYSRKKPKPAEIRWLPEDV